MKITGQGECLFGFRTALRELENYFEKISKSSEFSEALQKAYVSYTIIQLIRFCGQFNKENVNTLTRVVRDTVDDPRLQLGLIFYKPTGNNSRLIPLFLKMKWVKFTIWACQRMARRRYR